MMTQQQKAGIRKLSGIIRLVVSAIAVAWLAYLLCTAPWSKGGGFLMGYLAFGIIPLVLIFAVFPDGIQQVFGSDSPVSDPGVSGDITDIRKSMPSDAWRIIDPLIAKVVSQRDLMAEQLQGGRSTRELSYTIVLNIAIDELRSGRHHTYRGVVSFTGAMIRSLADRVSDAMHRESLISDDQRLEDIKVIAQVVKEAG